MAIDNAIAKVRESGDLPVPLHIRNAPTKLMKNLGYGKDYKYAHSYEGNFISDNFLPEEIKGTIFFDPGSNPKEDELRRRLSMIWKDIYGYGESGTT
jgi:putative ATPase